ncbi:acyl-CoA dehydrogenase family protein [Plantactinospora siamensis]|uniref:Acyl-CoA dehydrogenase family protein n=1 Tax=Plantactinospora siamensis TaxID=555372 RepID=A0ABV6NWN6_9ACTN
MRTDEDGEMCWSALAALRDWGFPEYLVPEQFGGRLRTFDELFALCRVVARRDLRAAVSFGTALLGANPVWLWGSPDQRRWLAGQVRDGRLGSFAMSERDHGSDLAGCMVTARPTEDGYLLSGEKWPIGNAIRGTFCTVYARTGNRDFSLLLLDKAALPADRWSNTDPVPTLGLRGHDMSGIVFDDCPVPGGAVLGTPGSGIAQTLKTLQVTRTLIGALSLGSLDTALRITVDHAASRRLYGAPVHDLPVVRDILVRAYLDLLIGECVAAPALRAISAAPGRLSLWSAIVKYLLPATVDAALVDLGTVLSARGWLRDSLSARLFQKVQRDHSIAGIFEGTSHVNLAGIADQLPFVLPRPAAAGDEETLAGLFDRNRPGVPWQPDGRALQLTNGGRDEITAGWAEVAGAVLDSATAPAPLRAVVAELDAAHRDLRDRFAGEPGGRDPRSRLLALELARGHCVLYAANCVLRTWRYDPGPGEELLTACLERLAQRLTPLRQMSPSGADRAWRLLTEGVAEHRLLSLTPVPLPASAALASG